MTEVAWDLPGFVAAHTERGECKCGQCIDRGDRADPTGHTVDIAFFKVALRADETKERIAETLRHLTAEHNGEFADCNPLDGKDHNFMELGAWLGSQGIALQYMAVGTLVGLFKLITPRTIFGAGLSHADEQQMAGGGLVIVRATEAAA